MMHCALLDPVCHVEQAFLPGGPLFWPALIGAAVLVLIVLGLLRGALGNSGTAAVVGAVAGAAAVYTITRAHPAAPPVEHTLGRDTIVALQKALARRQGSAHYAGAIDGIYGMGTHGAVNGLERALGLPPTAYDPQRVHIRPEVLDALGISIRSKP